MPSIFIWALYWKYFEDKLYIFIFITLCAIIWGFLFDIAGTHFGVWFYDKTLSFSFLGLPLEEYLLLLLLPQEIIAILLLIRRKIYE